jgi:hypothetical protein
MKLNFYKIFYNLFINKINLSKILENMGKFNIVK